MDARIDCGYVPWNKRKLMGQKQPLKPKDVWAIRFRLQLEHRTRDLALFNLGIDSKLRGCDLAARATVMQKKTRHPVKFEITEQLRTNP